MHREGKLVVLTPTNADGDTQIFSGRTILIVDDDPTNVQALARILSPLAKVIFALDGTSALALAREARPDLVLLDIQMPGLDGFAVCEQLRTFSGMSDLPVIFVTSQNDIASELAALEAGAVDFIAKPFVPPLVLARVRTHLRIMMLTEALQHEARTDALTGLANRRYFDEVLLQEWRRANRAGGALSLLIMDIDHFKRFNDRYGHPAGDDCLRRIAEGFRSLVRRPADMLARYGGEEFAMLLPDTDREGACHVARQLVERTRALAINHKSSPSGRHVTVSVGASCFDMKHSGESRSKKRENIETVGSGAALIASSDRGLYRAKAEGRDRWVYEPFEAATNAESPCGLINE